MAELPQPADGLHPSEDLLDQFALPLADLVAGMPGGSVVNRTPGDLLRDVGRDAEGAILTPGWRGRGPGRKPNWRTPAMCCSTIGMAW